MRKGRSKPPVPIEPGDLKGVVDLSWDLVSKKFEYK